MPTIKKKVDPMDQAIRAAAATKYGAANVTVLQVNERETTWNPGSSGAWFWLVVNGEPVCRRRTKTELLAAVKERAESAHRNTNKKKGPE